MSKKTLLKQMEFFDLITSKKLTPNQYYILCSMKDSISPLMTNLHLELRLLKGTGWLTDESMPRLTPQSYALIEQIESYFVTRKKKTSSDIIGQNYQAKIQAYINIFPNVQLPSGKSARSAFKNVENAFRWFFENHNYSWDIVLKATETYVDKYQSKNWKFMRTSQYFIRKQESDRSFNSELADYCAIIDSGGTVESIPTFSTKVV